MSVATNNRHIEKFERDIRSLRTTFGRLGTASDAEDRQDIYIQFVRIFKVASDLLVAIALGESKSRGFGRRIENEMKSDPVLKYLIVTRNVEDHPASKSEPFPVETSGGSVVVNEVFQIQSVGKLAISNSTFNGQVVNGELSVTDGRITRLRGNLSVDHIGGELCFNDVQDQQGVQHKPPLHLVHPNEKAEIFFCRVALSWLESRYDWLGSSD